MEKDPEIVLGICITLLEELVLYIFSAFEATAYLRARKLEKSRPKTLQGIPGLWTLCITCKPVCTYVYIYIYIYIHTHMNINTMHVLKILLGTRSTLSLNS